MLRHALRPLQILCVLPLTFSIQGCGSDQPSGGAAASEVPVEDLLARERAAAHFNAPAARLSAARDALRPLVEREDAKLEDLVHAGAIEIGAGDYDAAEAFFARAQVLNKGDLRIAYMRGCMFNNNGFFEEALAQFEIVHAGAPEDLPTMLCMAQALRELERDERCEEVLESIVSVGIDNGGSWYAAAVYRLSQHFATLGLADETRRYRDLWTQLSAQGFKPPSVKQIDEGSLGGVQAPVPAGTRVAGEKSLPEFTAEAPILPELAGAADFRLHDLNGDRLLDVLAWGETGVQVAFQGYDGWRVQRLHSGAARFALAFDLGNDDDLDVLVATSDSASFYEQTGKMDAEEWGARNELLPDSPGVINSMVALDADHEGDLDLILVGTFGARLWRNDGASQEEGRFTDVTSEAGLPAMEPLSWCIIEDYDSDQDVDFLLGGASATYLMSNLRGGLFEERAADDFGPKTRFASKPVVADIDGDARPDLLVRNESGEGSTIFSRRAEGGYQRDSIEWTIPTLGDPLQTDIDLDGSLDLIWPTAGKGCAGVLALATESEALVQMPGAESAVSLSVADIDRDADNDLIQLTSEGIQVHSAQIARPRGSGLEWIGGKDNKRAIGAICEARVGGSYRRIFWRGDSQLVGLGDVELVDIVRITWPNGVVQTEIDIEAGYLPVDTNSGPFIQAEGLIGSCPFLYTWNGEEFEFISDVLGITPLGLPMAPGMLVPPDHDEFVLVRGDQLQEKDGKLTMQFTEELREVTYLDRIRLDVVDHPIGSEVFPDERFCFPPFPVAHTHSVVDPLPAMRVTGSDGKDWTETLATTDDVHAVPFEPLGGQFLGLATPHWFDLEFDKERIAGAKKLRLVFTGWFYWTDASVNMASARTPGIDFVPPLLQVPDGAGGWRDTGPPIGFPAGKTKSMVIDVTDLLSREDPRLRLFSTLRLYWDRIVLATDDDDAELQVASLEPKSARLWRRGFSLPIPAERDDLPERFDYERKAVQMRWNQHPGLYTKLGDCLPLVMEVEDQYVIMGSGDALEVQFDASELPPLAEGFVRDYLVFMDGWAKDRDPNTVEALEVEPLPFHGMSGYPYREDEGFPDTPEHRAWRREWNTRPAYEQVVPISPSRQVEWLLGATRP
ncbi:MAG: hypothetical protein ACI841_001197 [Planctomycetota bacterium]|jgi:hypothetical protein